jgi:hypothetical protein
MTNEKMWCNNELINVGEYRSPWSETCSIYIVHLMEVNPGLKGNNVHYSIIKPLT